MLALLATHLLDAAGNQTTLARQPYEVRSASGVWRAAIDPSTRTSAGPGLVRVERGGELAWERELPFTFVEAVLADDGTLAGYGYSGGVWGWTPEGEFLVAIVDARGVIRLDDRSRSTRGGFGASHTDLHPLGLLLDGEERRLVVRTPAQESSSRECWWSFALHSGELLPSLQLNTPTVLDEAPETPSAVAPIRGTPLFLVEWIWRDRSIGRGQFASRWFTVVDDDGDVLWSSGPTDDFYTMADDDGDAQFEQLRASSAILDVRTWSAFELHFVSQSARVRFAAIPDAASGGWSIRESGREAWLPEVAARPHDSVRVEPLELASLGEAALEVELRPRDPRTSVLGFEPQADGALHFARRVAPGAIELCRTNSRGDVVQRVAAADVTADAYHERWIALRGGAWLAVAPASEADSSRAWLVHGASGAARALEKFEACDASSLAATPDGGFAALSEGPRAGVWTVVLRKQDSSGALEWSVAHAPSSLYAAGSDWRPASLALTGAEDLAVDSDGAIHVLCENTDLDFVAKFDVRGEHVGNVALEYKYDEAAGATAAGQRRPSELLVEPSGAYLVWERSPWMLSRWTRFAGDGRELETQPTRCERSSAPLGESWTFAVDALGALWSSRTTEVVRYDASGTARTRFGAAPDPRVIHAVASMHFDERGRLVAFDRDSRAALAFRANGELDAVIAAPTHALGLNDAEDLHLCAGPHGNNLVQPGWFSEDWLELDPDGRLIAQRGLDGDRAQWASDGSLWIGRMGSREACDVRRVAADGRLLARIERTPQGRFFDAIDALGLGPQDGVAVLARSAGERLALLYDSGGTALRTLGVPGDAASQRYGETVAWRGDWVMIQEQLLRGALLLDARTGEVRHVSAPGIGALCAWTLSPDGREVWCARAKPLSVLRFALPE